jgi:hypothetical protein
MRNSQKTKRSSKGKSSSKTGKKASTRTRLGPITIEDFLSPEVEPDKDDVRWRELQLRTEPTNDSSPTIKRRFIPLDNPKRVLSVLTGIADIKNAVAGNNILTGPLRYNYWRGCLSGEALRKFNEAATAVGTETVGNLVQVEQRLIANFAPREVLVNQLRYMRHSMRKPYSSTTRQYVGAVNTLNETLAEMPPLFNASQKIPVEEILDIMAANAPYAKR